MAGTHRPSRRRGAPQYTLTAAGSGPAPSRPDARGPADFVLGVLAVTLLAAGALAIRDVAVNPDSPAQPGAGPVHLLTPPPLMALGAPRQLSVLLVGADDRGGERGRADTIMVAYLAPREKRAALLSIQRDTKTRIPGHGEDKINHAYKFGDVRLLRQTVEELLGERVDRHAKLDFETFEQAVDILGGLTITVPDVEGRGRGMNYDDHADGLHIRLKPGRQRLNGEQAIGYVRYRRDSDLKRAERQREFVKVAAQQHMRAVRLPALLRAVGHIRRKMETDIPTGEALRLAAALRGIPPENILSAMLPTRSAPAGGVYYSRVREQAAAELQADIRSFLAERGPAQRGLKGSTVAVLNGSGTSGAAQRAAELITRYGATVTAVRNADRFDHAVTEFVCRPEATRAAEEARRLLNVPHASVRVDERLAAPGAAGIEVTVGRDFGNGRG